MFFIFNTKGVSEARKVTSANGRVPDNKFMVGPCSDHAPMMFGSRIGIQASTVLGDFCLDFGVHFCVAGAVFGEVGGWCLLLRALQMTFYMWRRSIMRVILRGRRSIWWGWRVMPVAPRIVNDVLYVTKINHESHFTWQVQYLVRLAGDARCFAHYKWRFICDEDQARESFCVAGAVFGEVGGRCLLLREL